MEAMPKTISFASLKGGTGKTVITFNVAGLLASRGYKCLVIDFDPQYNSTSLLFDRSKYEIKSSESSQEIFLSDKPIDVLVKPSIFDNIDIIPSTISLTGVEIKVSSMIARESILKHWLEDNSSYLKRYDYILFDTNPTMSVININTFLIADSILLVSDIDIDSLNAIKTFQDLYYPIRRQVNRELPNNIKGIVVNRVKQSNKVSKDFMDFVYSNNFPFKDIRLETYIHDAVDIARTKVNKAVIGEWAIERANKEFNALVDELLEKSIL